MDIDDVGLRVEVVIPDFLQQHRAGDNLALMSHEMLEKTKLARLQQNRAPGASDGSGEQIVVELPHGKLRDRRFRISPASEHFEPGEKLGEGERFHEVVVATFA